MVNFLLKSLTSQSLTELFTCLKFEELSSEWLNLKWGIIPLRRPAGQRRVAGKQSLFCYAAVRANTRTVFFYLTCNSFWVCTPMCFLPILALHSIVIESGTKLLALQAFLEHVTEATQFSQNFTVMCVTCRSSWLSKVLLQLQGRLQEEYCT